jgi:hyperosmotically inducible protein
MKTRNRLRIGGMLFICSVLAAMSGCNRTDETAGTTPQTKSAAAGSQTDDSAITAKVKSALGADSNIKSRDIKVETNNGDVMLSGFVDNQEQIDRSTAAAKNVEGVKNVTNMLSLKNGPSTVGTKIDDSVVTAKVKTALMRTDELKSTDISVVTNKGDVQLSGFVDNEQQRTRAAEIAQQVDGVKAVSNQLSIKK